MRNDKYIFFIFVDILLLLQEVYSWFVYFV